MERYIIQYFDGNQWINVSEWFDDETGWNSLGDDTVGYRMLDADGYVIREGNEF